MSEREDIFMTNPFIKGNDYVVWGKGHQQIGVGHVLAISTQKITFIITPTDKDACMELTGKDKPFKKTFNIIRATDKMMVEKYYYESDGWLVINSTNE